MKLFAMTIVALMMLPVFVGCEKGHYTDDRHYIGDPERVEAAGDEERERTRPR